MVFSQAQLRDMARAILEREGRKDTPQAIEATVKELRGNLELLRSGQITPGLAGQMRGIEELMGQFQAAKMERDLRNVARVVSASWTLPRRTAALVFRESWPLWVRRSKPVPP